MLDMAYDGDAGQVLFAVANDGPSVLLINDTSNSVSNRFSPRQAFPGAIAFDAGTDESFVVDGDVVDVVSAITNHLVTAIPVGEGPLGLVYDPALGEVFVANDGSNNVSVISDATDRVVASIPVGDYPTGVAYRPSHGRHLRGRLKLSLAGHGFGFGEHIGDRCDLERCRRHDRARAQLLRTQQRRLR